MNEEKKSFTPLEILSNNKAKIRNKRFLTGFTLIELLVTVAIISLFLSIGLVRLNTARMKARDSRRKADIHQIMMALEMYYHEKGEYPTSGGANSPDSGWSNSGDSSWDALGNELIQYIDLPEDPRNDTSGWAESGSYNYAYNSTSSDPDCAQQWYVLVYKLEELDIAGPGIISCDGTPFNYTDTVTVGMCPGCQ